MRQALRIGVAVEPMGLPLRQALAEAARLGVGGVELHAVGELAPAQLSQTGRRELRYLLRSHQLEATALRCPLRRGLDVAEGLEERLEYLKQVLSLSFDLGARRVVLAAGQVPEQETDPRASLLREALQALAAHGDRVGATLALDTGLESGETLARFLARFDTAALGVNFDPANLALHGFDPYASVTALAGRIVHVHAKDIRRATANRLAQEVPLGHGELDWMQLLDLLRDTDYRGWVTVVRDSGARRREDLAIGVGFLRRFLS
jgi:L-ribulose-5-phosphate 3-epimerase